LSCACGSSVDRRRGGGLKPPHWPEEKKREKTRFQRTYAVYLQRHRSLMTFKAILQALEGGGLKFIDATTNFRPFYSKKVIKFACLQPLNITWTAAHAHGKIILGRLLLLINKLQTKIIYIFLDR